MGFLDLFIERTDEKKPVATVGLPSIKPGVLAPSSANLSSVAPAQQELDKFAVHFDELFDKANLPGPDYYEFTKMAQAMVGLTDEVKYPAVFGALKIQGLTKPKLLDTAAQYIKVIEDDEKQFASILDTKVLADINKKKSFLETNNDSIKKKEELIVQLQTEILQDKQKLTTLESEIVANERLYNDKTVVYKAASENRKVLIKADIDKINRIIN